MPILQRISWYHTMIDMAVWRFMLIILSFIGINFIFASIYYVIGIEHLDGYKYRQWMGEIWASLFFLVHKRLPLLVMVTSVPLVFWPALSAEALIGLLFATGLFFEGLVNPQLKILA
jgi:inward rectifier potassium channel